MKTIEQMARDAGINVEFARPCDGGIDTWFGDQYLPSGSLQRFAALVAERCAQIVEGVCLEAADLPGGPSHTAYRDAILAEFPKP